MYQKAETFFVKLTLLLLFIFAGVWLGFEAFELWRKVDSTGTFVSWESLNGQPTFEHIFYAHSWEVWIQAKDGKKYVYRTGACDEMTCYRWLEENSDTQFDLGMQQIIRSGCQHSYRYYNDGDSLNGLPPRYPPQQTASPLECVVVVEHNPYNGAESQIYYVLLDNGDVWMWKYIPDLSQEFILLFAIPLAGLTAGILIWYFSLTIYSYLPRRKRTVTEIFHPVESMSVSVPRYSQVRSIWR